MLLDAVMWSQAQIFFSSLFEWAISNFNHSSVQLKLNNQALDSAFTPVSPGEVFKVYGSIDTVKQIITILTNNNMGCRCNLFSSVNVLAKLHTPLTRTVRTGWSVYSRVVMNVTLAACTRLQNSTLNSCKCVHVGDLSMTLMRAVIGNN